MTLSTWAHAASLAAGDNHEEHIRVARRAVPPVAQRCSTGFVVLSTGERSRRDGAREVAVGLRF